MDRACAVAEDSVDTASAGPCAGDDRVIETRAALMACRSMVALVTTSYFSRLWCTLEWAQFLARVAPHYRRLDVVLPRAPLELALWHGLAFEPFVRGTALALLARGALLLGTLQCPAFGSEDGSGATLSLEPAWWRLAREQAKAGAAGAKARASRDTKGPEAFTVSQKVAGLAQARSKRPKGEGAGGAQPKGPAAPARPKPASDSVKAGAYARRHMVSAAEGMTLRDVTARAHAPVERSREGQATADSQPSDLPADGPELAEESAEPRAAGGHGEHAAASWRPPPDDVRLGVAAVRVSPERRDAGLFRHLEPLRQRALRSRGALSDAFGAWLTPISALDRLVPVSQPVDAFALPPAILASPLQLRVVDHPRLALLCLRPAGGGWRRVLVPQKLGAAALATAARQLWAVDGRAPSAEVQIILPRLALEVIEAGGARVVVGSRAVGELAVVLDQDTRGADQSAGCTRVLLAGGADWPGEARPSDEGAKAAAAGAGLDDTAGWQAWLNTPRSAKQPGSAEPGSGTDAWLFYSGGSARSTRPRMATPRRDSPGARAGGAAAAPTGATPGWCALQTPRGGSATWPPRAPGPRRVPRLPALGAAEAARTPRGHLAPPGLAERAAELAGERRGWALASVAEGPAATSAAAPPREPRWRWTPAEEDGVPPGPPGGAVPSDGALEEVLRAALARLLAAQVGDLVPLRAAAEAHGLPLAEWGTDRGAPSLLSPRRQAKAGSARGAPRATLVDSASQGLAHEAAPLRADTWGAVRDAVGGALAPRAAAAPPAAAPAAQCRRCGRAELAVVPLERSMLRFVWDAPCCAVCLSCGSIEPRPGDVAGAAAVPGGSTVLQVTSSLSCSKPSKALLIQRLATKVLRLNPGQILIAFPKEEKEARPTQAKPRVAFLSFTSPGAGLCAAAAVLSGEGALLVEQEEPHAQSGPFRLDPEWAQVALAGTGLDVKYGKDRMVPVHEAIQEIDDWRMMPRRSAVPPLVVWAELNYVLGPDYDTARWCQACKQALNSDHLSLPGAIIMDQRVCKLRKAMSPGSAEVQGGPLALHHALMAREEDAETVLGAALRRVGILSGTAKALRGEGYKVLQAKFTASAKRSSGPAAKKMVGTGDRAVAKRMSGTALMRAKVYALKFAKQANLEATTTMQELHFRGMESDIHAGPGGSRLTTAAAGKDMRVMLRSRRALHKLQVLAYMSRLEELMLEPDGLYGAQEWFAPERDQAPQEDQTSDEDAPTASRARSTQVARPGEDMIVQRLVKHVLDYINHAGVLLKGLRLLASIVNVFGSSGRPMASRCARPPRPVEQSLLESGFVDTALRVVYRHASRGPALAGEALALLDLLCWEGSAHGLAPRALAELSMPRQLLTLIQCALACHRAGHLEQLQTCLGLLKAVAWLEPADGAPVLKDDRQREAVEILIEILVGHGGSAERFMAALQALRGLCRQPTVLRAAFAAGLGDALREWLRKSAAGATLEQWSEEAARASSTVRLSGLCGPVARPAVSLQHAPVAARGALPRLAEAEEKCWALLGALATEESLWGDAKRQGLRGDARRQSPKEEEEAEDQLLEQSLRSLRLALREARRDPRGSQWLPAMTFMMGVVDFDKPAFAWRITQGGGAEILLRECLSGDMCTILPLLHALMDVSRLPLPTPPAPLGTSWGAPAPTPRPSCSAQALAPLLAPGPAEPPDGAVAAASAGPAASEPEPEPAPPRGGPAGGEVSGAFARWSGAARGPRPVPGSSLATLRSGVAAAAVQDAQCLEGLPPGASQIEGVLRTLAELLRGHRKVSVAAWDFAAHRSACAADSMAAEQEDEAEEESEDMESRTMPRRERG
ncbi:unnamed protein product [Prorocentrum cordatum]|uniref:TIR domain-containing protein n=1 Tax=Prorocentrum cordatum TaxID=2364126 RepID=A0ABN9RV13_9DINO|nr:unnamed protein product [Polarella glacialis]